MTRTIIHLVGRIWVNNDRTMGVKIFDCLNDNRQSLINFTSKTKFGKHLVKQSYLVGDTFYLDIHLEVLYYGSMRYPSGFRLTKPKLSKKHPELFI